MNPKISKSYDPRRRRQEHFSSHQSEQLKVMIETAGREMFHLRLLHVLVMKGAKIFSGFSFFLHGRFRNRVFECASTPVAMATRDLEAGGSYHRNWGLRQVMVGNID
ncbi:hypothetical protein TNIN_176161 [Trichonephila inaurata madagascariensis]|uniref:Uncharacterized protein n=1 Tax=Trichonephila inaurata madagascariensis TaxID=2747483 RepID=A0A8X6YQK0_9ARAC|nr:hypothetical protein TNIN_176161 [Trichonephila inaurata madagascariensis]